MDFSTLTEMTGDVILINIPERLTANTSDDFKKYLKESVEQGHYKFVINLKKTEYLDSSGLGAIVSKIAQTRTNDGDVRLASPGEYVMSLLELTHINQVLKIFDTAEQALASFGE